VLSPDGSSIYCQSLWRLHRFINHQARSLLSSVNVLMIVRIYLNNNLFLILRLLYRNLLRTRIFLMFFTILGVLAVVILHMNAYEESIEYSVKMIEQLKKEK
jgi:cellulose synthase/poly-beta-1,6-N-acetylglucosamine synthase-like glycosyltransferase